MKYTLFVATILLAQYGFAKANFPRPAAPCTETLENKFHTDSKGTDWGFMGLQKLSNKEASVMIKEALAEDEKQDRPKMMALVGNKGITFFMMAWSAPSNTGSTIIAVDKKTCSVVEDLMYWSEE